MASIALCEAEKLFLLHGVEQDCRNDGRSCLQCREFRVRSGLVSTANGSASVKIEGQTDVLVGIKAELDTPDLDRPKQGKIDFFIDCSALASPRFEGREGKELGVEIYNALKSVYCEGAAAISNLNSLCILPSKHCWLLNIDIVILDCSAGSLYDVISLAVKAALHDTKIPAVEVDSESGEIHVESETWQCLDSEGWFNWESCPLLITISKLGSAPMQSLSHGLIVDATLQEEACATSSIIVGVDAAGKMSGCRKCGTHSLSFSTFSAMLQIAVQIATELHQSLKQQLADEAEQASWLQDA
ncbi:LOW QUALITY PROTEIN: exosome complex exonuclease RRP42-like [Convolutriloba macropyga]|uniref:LOW QUALITY PROTEIN: exosome complex exonuclease RRP42-like n=1 Tax=Convolutriloba macropyga TaxID=536237 RepID=UPI003F520B5E